MNLTQTKISFGYGYAVIKVINNNNQNADSNYPGGFVFRVDNSSYPEIIEVKDVGETIYNDKRQYVYGYHLNFTLTLREDSTLVGAGASDYCDLDAMIRFKHFYYRNTRSDNLIYIMPRATININGFQDTENVSGFYAYVNNISFNNITGSAYHGQEMVLSCSTKNMIKKDEWNEFYRKTTDGLFDTYSPLLTGIPGEATL